jgi:hypothetical protein
MLGRDVLQWQHSKRQNKGIIINGNKISQNIKP